MKSIATYLKKLGFTGDIINTQWGSLFLYEVSPSIFSVTSIQVIPFLFYEDSKQVFHYHDLLWNENKVNVFIAVGVNKTYIIKAKEKPKDEDNPFDRSVVLNKGFFDYGTSTIGFKEVVDSVPFSKEKIDNSIFFNFVINQLEAIKNEVDEHLLNNLIELKKELSFFDNNSENINRLILKCLFVKYFEDRNILTEKPLVNALKSGSPQELENCFETIGIINGDILKGQVSINEKHINELSLFFTRDYKVYKQTRRPTLFFPYKFDKIPIQLISNVYEEFLGKTDEKAKKQKGIYYTRTFVVDFMLSHTIYPMIKQKPNATVLDPACGSGAFLVQAFKEILNCNRSQNLNIDQKGQLLKEQIFGIDIDEGALQITAFSLYLTLLDGIDNEEIKEQIEIKQPILPPLIGSNLLQKNTITTDVEFDIEYHIGEQFFKNKYTTFDCIVANPPWTALKANDAKKDEQIAETINVINKSETYKNVSMRQLSQCFLLKMNQYCHQDTNITFIVNNSNFLNERSEEFRTELLTTYRLTKYYELSDIAPILFKNTSHPCSVLIMDKKVDEIDEVQYITPKLTNFSKNLRLIHYTSKDIKKVKQEDLKVEDILWRIFVKGNWTDYQLIKKIALQASDEVKSIVCSRGINPNNARPKGKPDIKDRLDGSDLEQYYFSGLSKFNINQIFERGRKDYNGLFKGKRILLKRTPSTKDGLKLTCAFTDKEIVFGENVIALKLNEENLILPQTAILNSCLIGYYFTHLSAQVNKGVKMTGIRVNELKYLPFLNLSDDYTQQLNKLYSTINKHKKQNKPYHQYEKEVNELIFKLYNLLEFEKEIINEFYQINVERINEKVKIDDIQIYANKFREIYHRMIKEELRLNVSYQISANLGAIVKFRIVPKEEYLDGVERGKDNEHQILQIVKNKQIQNEMLSRVLNEDKVKIYNHNEFYIIKSKYFKDWTKRQAIVDANEEIHDMMQKLK